MTNQISKEKVIPFTAEKKIYWTPVRDNVFAYKEEVVFNNEVFSSIEGLSTLEEIEKTTPLEKINSLKKVLGKRPLEVLLVPNEAVEYARTTPLSYSENLQGFADQIIDQPYSYIEEFGANSVQLVLFDYGDLGLYDFDLNRLPQAIYFDYISQNVDNYHYNLEELLVALEGRDDIEFLKEGIQNIPHYNSEEGRDEYLNFVWKPTPVDFETIKHDLDDFYNRFERIISKIFGVNKINNY